MLYECDLKPVKLAAGNAFDRGDLPAFELNRQRQAGQDALAVHQNRAGPAGALVASLLGPGKAQMFTQNVQQRRARVDRKRMVDAVDLQQDQR